MAGEHLEPHGGIFDRFDWKRPLKEILNFVIRMAVKFKGQETIETELTDWITDTIGRGVSAATKNRIAEALGETEH